MLYTLLVESQYANKHFIPTNFYSLNVHVPTIFMNKHIFGVKFCTNRYRFNTKRIVTFAKQTINWNICAENGVVFVFAFVLSQTELNCIKILWPNRVPSNNAQGVQNLFVVVIMAFSRTSYYTWNFADSSDAMLVYFMFIFIFAFINKNIALDCGFNKIKQSPNVYKHKANEHNSHCEYNAFISAPGHKFAVIFLWINSKRKSQNSIENKRREYLRKYDKTRYYALCIHVSMDRWTHITTNARTHEPLNKLSLVVPV